MTCSMKECCIKALSFKGELTSGLFARRLAAFLLFTPLVVYGFLLVLFGLEMLIPALNNSMKFAVVAQLMVAVLPFIYTLLFLPSVVRRLRTMEKSFLWAVLLAFYPFGISNVLMYVVKWSGLTVQYGMLPQAGLKVLVFSIFAAFGMWLMCDAKEGK